MLLYDHTIPIGPDGIVGGRRIAASSSTAAVLLDVILGRARPPWMADALCREYPEVNFFPERGQATAPAKAVCARCKVREECAAFSLAEGINHGLWGGLTARERQRLRRAS